MTSAVPVEFLLFAPSPLAEALAASLPTPLASERVLSFALEEETGVIFHRLQERVNTLLTPSPVVLSSASTAELEGAPENVSEREESKEEGEPDEPQIATRKERRLRFGMLSMDFLSTYMTRWIEMLSVQSQCA